MTNRERLIEILEDTLHEWECDVQLETLSQIADHLLANGVIVPPCKVGDTVYCIRTWPSGRKTIHPFEAPDWDWIMEHLNDFGKTIFTSRKEAEKVLEER